MFTGTAKDYFGIWIVNVLLTIVTLGIWSAWAKVRTLRYFYGNTNVGGSSFDYVAKPITILKGRLVAAAVFIAVGLSEFISPWLPGALYFLVFLALPWVMYRSLRFSARMTTWRNVRFDFDGTYWGVFRAFFLYPALGAITLFVLMPWAARKSALYFIRGYRFGEARFDTEATVKAFYKIYVMAVGLFAAAFLLSAGAALLVGVVLQVGEGAFTIVAAGVIVAAILVGPFIKAQTRNLLVNAMTLADSHRFESSLSGLKMGWILLSNGIVSLLTLGMMYPWAKVRLWRYQTDHLRARPGGSLDKFADTQTAAGSAAASEFADLGDFDVAF